MIMDELWTVNLLRWSWKFISKFLFLNKIIQDHVPSVYNANNGWTDGVVNLLPSSYQLEPAHQFFTCAILGAL